MNVQRTEDGERRENNLHILEFVYRKFYGLLYNYGIKLVNEPDRVKDFIQDIFLKIYQNNDLDTIENWQVYLLRAMRNIVYDYFASRKETINIDTVDFLLPDSSPLTASLFALDDSDQHKQQHLLKAIRALPAKQQHILYLYYLRELSHKEIAEILDINPQSSMNALSKAIHSLRAEMKWEETAH